MKKILQFFLSLSFIFLPITSVFAQEGNVYTAPDNSYTFVVPSNWSRIPQESIDKAQELAGEKANINRIVAGYGVSQGENFNPYLQVFSNKKLSTVVNEETLNSKANELQKMFQTEIDKNTDLQEKVGMSNSVVESAEVDTKNGIVSIYMISDVSTGAVVEGKLYMIFGRQEYVMLGFYNVAPSMDARLLNKQSELTQLTEKTVASFSFSDDKKYDPNAVSTSIFDGVLEKGLVGLVTGGLFALILGFGFLSKRKKSSGKAANVSEIESITMPSTHTSRSKKNFFSVKGITVFILIAIILFLILYFTQSRESTSEEVKPVPVENTTSSIEDNFNKKLECEKVINPIKEELEEKELERLSAPSDSIAMMVSERFNFGFYSPTEDSCLYVTFLMTNIGEREDTINIYDALTKRRLYRYTNDGVGGQSFSEYVNKISELSNGEIQIE